jgi:hypothetical protein
MQRGDPSVFSGLQVNPGNRCPFAHWVRELSSC